MRTLQSRLGLIALLVSITMVGAISSTAQARESVTPSHQQVAPTGVINPKVGQIKAPINFTSAAGTFKGRFIPHSFRMVDGELMARGRVGGVVDRVGHAPQSVSRWHVTMPVKEINGAAPKAPMRPMAAAALTCDVLNLVLGPLDLNLLGLEIHLDTVVLDIIANPAGGLLGQLLCAIANLLSGGFTGTLAQLAALLELILTTLGL
jgi:hypothetical protein